MIRLQEYLRAVPLLLVLGGCSLDNYDGPDASVHGSFIDQDTEELVEQDIIRGTQIEYIEHGYAAQAPQFMAVKTDGTYRNEMIFSNTYTVQPVRGNFVQPEPQEVEIVGETQLDFIVQPYIRVRDLEIRQEGTRVTATFKLEQTVENNVVKAGLYVHEEPLVGEPVHRVRVEQEVGAEVDPGEEFTLELDAADHAALETGRPYFFRVGALIDVPEAKLNYAPAERLTL